MVAAVAVASCGRLGFDTIAADGDAGEPDANFGLPDAGTAACSSFGPFGTAERVFTSSAIDDGPVLSADGLTLYLGRNAAGTEGTRDLWMASRADLGSPFDDAVNLTAQNSASFDAEPALSADGLTLYFESNRDGGYRIWRATRNDPGDAFSAPELLAATDGSQIADARGPSVTADGLELYFHSTEGGQTGLWRVTRSAPDQPFGVPSEIVELAGGSIWGYSGISSDGLEYFYVDNSGLLQIMVARRPDRSSPFSAPESVAELDSGDRDSDPQLSLDGRSLLFSSDRSGGNYDIWMANRDCLP